MFRSIASEIIQSLPALHRWPWPVVADPGSRRRGRWRSPDEWLGAAARRGGFVPARPASDSRHASRMGVLRRPHGSRAERRHPRGARHAAALRSDPYPARARRRAGDRARSWRMAAGAPRSFPRSRQRPLGPQDRALDRPVASEPPHSLRAMPWAARLSRASIAINSSDHRPRAGCGVAQHRRSTRPPARVAAVVRAIG